jgi:hypothetical protein
VLVPNIFSFFLIVTYVLVFITHPLPPPSREGLLGVLGSLSGGKAASLALLL